VLRDLHFGYNKGATTVCYLTERRLDSLAAGNRPRLHQTPAGVASQPLVLQAANLPPFSVFTGYGDPYRREQAFSALGVFVQYVFLATGERDKVVPDEAVGGRVRATIMEHWISGLKALDQGCE